MGALGKPSDAMCGRQQRKKPRWGEETGAEGSTLRAGDWGLCSYVSSTAPARPSSIQPPELSYADLFLNLRIDIL